jgi:hypothetical protein
VTSTETVSLNQWSHIAMTKTSSGIRVWVNGVGTSNTAISGTPQSSGSTAFSMGCIYTAGFTGHIDEIRITKGVARYTANFAPPTSEFTNPSAPIFSTPSTPLSNVTNTQLLLNFTNSAIYDTTGRHVVTTFNNAKVSTIEYKNDSSSIYLDGVDDGIMIPYTKELDFGTNSFTVECWFNCSSFASSRTIFSKISPTFGIVRESALYIVNSTTFRFYYGIRGTNQTNYDFTVPTMSINTWYHVAVTRDSNIFRVFLNGKLAAGTYSDAIDLNGSIPFWVGVQNDHTDVTADFIGYITNFRVTNGVARYNGNFTPPICRFPRVNSK